MENVPVVFVVIRVSGWLCDGDSDGDGDGDD